MGIKCQMTTRFDGGGVMSALTQAFLDSLAGAADSQGIVRLSALTDALENEVPSKFGPLRLVAAASASETGR